eukprot:10108568-Prorocentrum_lima.AAC.1
MTWYSDYWKSNMHLVQSRMHPSMWLMIKGKKPLKEARMAQRVPADKFAETHIWIQGQIKGNISLFADDMIQAGAKASN